MQFRMDIGVGPDGLWYWRIASPVAGMPDFGPIGPYASEAAAKASADEIIRGALGALGIEITCVEETRIEPKPCGTDDVLRRLLGEGGGAAC